VGEGLLTNVTIRRNTFYVDKTFQQDSMLHSGGNVKGYWEIKNCSNMVIEGNRFTGWASVLAWTGSNQNGLAPWITVSHITIRNNWYSPDETAGNAGVALIITENQYRTGTPPTDIQIYNNFFKNLTSLLQAGGGIGPWIIKHNTVLNDRSDSGSYLSIITSAGVLDNFTYKDNIQSFNKYGMQCFVGDSQFDTCYPRASRVILNNAIIDQASAQISPGVWGKGSILSPIKTDFSQIGFTDAANNNYRLIATSPYKGKGSNGKDPGVDMDELLEALTGGNLSPNRSK
jgi:hypothetical protein